MDWWGFLMKRAVLYSLLVLCLMFVVWGCKTNKDQDPSEGLTIEEDMIYEDEASDKDSGKPYDKDGDGFVDGWY